MPPLPPLLRPSTAGVQSSEKGAPREHIGERLGRTRRLSDSTVLFASGVAPEELYLATLCRDAPSLSP